MKKRVLSMLMVLIMMVGMMAVPAFAADGEGEDVCTHSMVWKLEGNLCAYACTICGEIEKAGTHADSDGDFKCDFCEGHIHSMTKMAYDTTQHWTVCADDSCDATGEKANHSWTVDTTNTDTTVTKYICTCGLTKSEHAHSWAAAWSGDADNHWHECQNAGCTAENSAKDGYAAHTWTKDTTNSTATNTIYTCTCGKTKTEHKHVWDTAYSHDSANHWLKCTDSTCASTNSVEPHYDYNGDGKCDVASCAAAVTTKKWTSITITGVTTPADGVAVDFGVSVSEIECGTPSVHWKRMTKIDGSDAAALTAANTYAAGCMYDLEIWVPHNKYDAANSDLVITVDGVKVPYYTTLAAYGSARNTFEGTNAVYRAHFDTKNGVPYFVISVLYGKVAGTHTCTYGAAWVTSSAQHYHKCTACDAVKDAAKHLDENKNGLCDVCNFEMAYVSTGTAGTGTATHTHTYGADWVEDMTNHWKQCTTCGNKTQTAKHADLNNTGKCDVCGFVMTAAAGHTHTYGTDWTETFAQHYKLCACGAKTEIAAHADLNNSGLCDVCGYAMTTTSTGTAVPPTGDDNAVFHWMTAMLISVLGLSATVLVARKRRED